MEIKDMNPETLEAYSFLSTFYGASNIEELTEKVFIEQQHLLLGLNVIQERINATIYDGSLIAADRNTSKHNLLMNIWKFINNGVKNKKFVF
jgi:hypothetical protein